MRDRLIELIQSKSCDSIAYTECMKKTSTDCEQICRRIPIELEDCEKLADHLLANGVVVPPVKVNQTVYVIDRADVQRPIKEKIVLEIQCGYSGDSFVLQDTPFRLRRAYNFGEINKTVFFTREEAEQKLKEGKR